MSRSQEEFRLSCKVADYLALALPSHVLWSHLPFGENRSAITGARLKRMGTKRGWPDYLVLHDRGTIALELKAEKGKRSPEQVTFGDAFTALGGDYFVCRSLIDVEAALRMAGVPLKAVAV